MSQVPRGQATPHSDDSDLPTTGGPTIGGPTIGGSGAGQPADAGSSNAPEFSVTELAGAIKRSLEDGFGYVRLRGEVSGYRGPHASGHCYFGLKDEKAKIDAVVWRGVFSKLKFKPEEGMEVIAHGRVTSYPNASKYQIVIDRMEPAGAGALMALLEERRRALGTEGLFDDDRKRRLPFLPRVVGIVTSPTGAVIRDMLAGFAERFPAHVIVWPVRVQGETSGAEVTAAIRGFNALQPGGAIPRPDVLIVARGGGSLEDLWGFNDESVVRAAADSTIPLISAVGHETDWTLLDLAADARAPTPTKAAEWAVPMFADLVEQTGGLAYRLQTGIRRQMTSARTQLKAAARGLPRVEDILGLPRQRFDAADKRLSRALLANTQAHHNRHIRVTSRLQPLALSQRIGRMREHVENVDARSKRAFRARIGDHSARLGGLSQLLASLSYTRVLQRGYALVRDDAGHTVRGVAAAGSAHVLEIEFHDGRIVVGGGSGSGGEHDSAAHSDTPASRAVASQKSRTRRQRKADQGKLFD